MINTVKYQLENFYTQAYPERDALGIEDVAQLGAGWASDVYGFTLKYDESDTTSRERLVLKTYNASPDGMDRALKERHALFNLRAARYPVPGVAELELESEHFDRPFIVMEHIDGRSMWDVYREADAAKQHTLIQMFVGMLVDLHALSAETLVPSLKPTGQFTLINREIHTMRGLMKANGLEMFTPVADWLYEHRQSVPCDTPAITHRDYHPWNVILTEGGRPYVIDWNWQLADPRFDVAWTLTLMRRSGHAAFADAVKTEYERVTGGEISELAYFEVVASLRWLLNVVHSVRTGEALRTESRDTFRDFIREPVAHALDLIHTRTGLTMPSVPALLDA